MFNISCWYNKGHDDQNKVEHISIICSNCGKKTGLSMKNMNTNHKYIIASFLLNKVLQHVGMSWIVEANKHLEYDMEKHNSYWITGSPWHNTFICKKLHGKVFEAFIRNARTDRYNLVCSIDAHEEIIHQKIMVEAAVVVFQHH